MSKYKPMSDLSIKRFISDETEIIHIIKTGFQDKYIVVFEDAFERSLGETIIGTKEEIEQKFNIEI